MVYAPFAHPWIQTLPVDPFSEETDAKERSTNNIIMFTWRIGKNVCLVNPLIWTGLNVVRKLMKLNARVDPKNDCEI